MLSSSYFLILIIFRINKNLMTKVGHQAIRFLFQLILSSICLEKSIGFFENFPLPVFDGFKCFWMFRTLVVYFWKMFVCLYVCDKNLG